MSGGILADTCGLLVSVKVVRNRTHASAKKKSSRNRESLCDMRVLNQGNYSNSNLQSIMHFTVLALIPVIIKYA